MEIRTFLVVLGVAGMATLNVNAGGLLSPKAADNQPTVVSGYNADPNLTATGLHAAPPHVVASKTKTVPGKSAEVTSLQTCTRRMPGSPKMIGECSSHACETMSCCAPAAAK